MNFLNLYVSETMKYPVEIFIEDPDFYFVASAGEKSF